MKTRSTYIIAGPLPVPWLVPCFAVLAAAVVLVLARTFMGASSIRLVAILPPLPWR